MIRKYSVSPASIWFLFFVALCLTLGGFTEQVLKEGRLSGWDEWALVYTEEIQTPDLTQVMIFLTYLGSGWFIWPLVFILLYLCIRRKKKLEAGIVAAVMGGGWMLGLALKMAIQRARLVPPAGEALIYAYGWSYPSGHAILATLFYFTLAYLVSKRFESKIVSWAAFLIAICICLIVAFSRVYLEVHYLTDVIAGLLAGLLWFTLCIAITEHCKLRSA